MKKWIFAIALTIRAGSTACAQQPASPLPPTEPREEVQRDAPIDEAAALIGRALFLRCFCAENNLTFDAQGRLTTSPKVTDWTLAGVNILKAERKGPGQIELQGVRVAIRFIPDRREFERHPQNDEKIRIQLADTVGTGDARQFRRTLDAVFAQGIDPGLQRAMPAYWRHSFDPQLPWPPDELAAQTIYVPGPNGQSLSPTGLPPLASDPRGPAVSAPVMTHRVDTSYTAAALKDRVKGGVLMRVIIDAEGLPRRIQLVRPLGYGLDERAVEALAKFRFTPAMREGKPVAAILLVNEDFTPPPPPPRN